MLSLLPDYADPLRLSALGKRYEGKIKLAELPRLGPLLASPEGDASFVLTFGVDQEKRPVVSVAVAAALIVQCQRCMGPMALAVDSVADLAVVSGPDEAERLPAELDPLLIEDGRVELRALIEDELLLSVPPAPMHARENCEVQLDRVNDNELAAHGPADAERENPFAALAGLRDELGKHD
ncbi:MAG: DUF177 domain-containing protein [Gammaproteobacteria bacterium]|nr:DUF177 domain-containing protein [Gammaproteobacteria bacterium]